MTQSEQVLTSPEERETMNEAVRSLRSAAPDGWERVRHEFRGTIGIDSAYTEVEDAVGETRGIAAPGLALDKMDDLRRMMYREQRGTWFTARVVIERDGRFSAEFDYDGEPEFVPPLTGSAYELDLQYFPRAEEYIPDWLHDRLREAEAEAGKTAEAEV